MLRKQLKNSDTVYTCTYVQQGTKIYKHCIIVKC